MQDKKSPLLIYREKISEIHTPQEIKEAFNSNNVICFGIREGYRGKRNLRSMIWEINPEAIIIDVDLCVFHSEPTVYCKRILVIDRNGNKESGNSILGGLHDSEGIVDCYVSFKENNCGIKRCILQTFDDKPKVVQKMNLLIDGEDMLVTVRHLGRADHEKMKEEK